MGIDSRDDILIFSPPPSLCRNALNIDGFWFQNFGSTYLYNSLVMFYDLIYEPFCHGQYSFYPKLVKGCFISCVSMCLSKILRILSRAIETQIHALCHSQNKSSSFLSCIGFLVLLMFMYSLSRLEIPLVTCELEFELNYQPNWLGKFNLLFHAHDWKSFILIPSSFHCIPLFIDAYSSSFAT